MGSNMGLDRPGHILRFTRPHDEILTHRIDEGWLSHLEGKDNLFPEIDYRVYGR
ncbi:MAG: DUF1957 domain-containing protein [Nitrospirae bacterium]|nr:DUF1957 domain-containing protein [Nitrospirota bacterium]